MAGRAPPVHGTPNHLTAVDAGRPRRTANRPRASTVSARREARARSKRKKGASPKSEGQSGASRSDEKSTLTLSSRATRVTELAAEAARTKQSPSASSRPHIVIPAQAEIQRLWRGAGTHAEPPQAMAPDANRSIAADLKNIRRAFNSEAGHPLRGFRLARMSCPVPALFRSRAIAHCSRPAQSGCLDSGFSRLIHRFRVSPLPERRVHSAAAAPCRG